MAPDKKRRIPIPVEDAARVLFASDRTCCVCCTPDKRVQIHHLDGDPSNNELRNLAVLCTDCHEKTLVKGGFGRGLDAEQIMLFRDDWLQRVAQKRTALAGRHERSERDADTLEVVTSIAETWRDAGEFELLATHYDAIGNAELRDKYIDRALVAPKSDEVVVYLREMQDRRDLIPQDVIEREEKRLADAPSQLARLYKAVGRDKDAVRAYLEDVLASLAEDNAFSAAYYLKELFEVGLVDELFVMALRQASDRGDLWWQVRALQELGWRSELHSLAREHREEIGSSANIDLKLILAEADGDAELAKNLRKRRAEFTWTDSYAVHIRPEDDTDGAST
jgi:hypothetical protein